MAEKLLSEETEKLSDILQGLYDGSCDGMYMHEDYAVMARELEAKVAAAAPAVLLLSQIVEVFAEFSAIEPLDKEESMEFLAGQLEKISKILERYIDGE